MSSLPHMGPGTPFINIYWSVGHGSEITSIAFCIITHFCLDLNGGLKNQNWSKSGMSHYLPFFYVCILLIHATHWMLLSLIIVSTRSSKNAKKISLSWTSYQIRKSAGCAYTGNAGNVFPSTDFKGNRSLAIPVCMSGSLKSGGGKNVPGIPGACITQNLTYLSRGPWRFFLEVDRWRTKCPFIYHNPDWYISPFEHMHTVGFGTRSRNIGYG